MFFVFLLLFCVPLANGLPIQVLLSFRNAIADRDSTILQSRPWLSDNKKIFKNCSKEDVMFLKRNGTIFENMQFCVNQEKVFCRSIISDSLRTIEYLDFIHSCAPIGCTEGEVDIVSMEYIEKGIFSSNYVDVKSRYFSVTYCNTQYLPTTGFWVTISFCGLFFVAAICGSCLKFYVGQKKKKMERVIDDIPSEDGWWDILFNWEGKHDETRGVLPNIIVTAADDANLSLSCTDDSCISEKNFNSAIETRKPSVCLSPIPFPKLKPSKKTFVKNNKNLSKIVVLKKSCSLRDLHSSTSSIERSIGISNQSVFVSPIHNVSGAACGASATNGCATPKSNPAMKLLLEVLGQVSVQKSMGSIKKNGDKEEGLDFPSKKEIVFCNSISTMALWAIILSQTTLFIVTSSAVENKEYLSELFHNKLFQFIVNENVHLTTFFFISGLSSAFHLRRSLRKKNEENNPPLLPFLTRVISRFLEVLPLYVIIMLLWINVLPLLATGPSWYTVKANDNCYGLNWINFLYLNNFYELSLQCMPWSWILACEFQLFTAGMIVVCIRLKISSLRKLLLPLTLTVSMVVTVMVAYKNNVSSTPIHELFKGKPKNTSLSDFLEHYSGQKQTAFELLNIKPYYQLQAYCIGGITGTYFFLNKAIINTSAAVLICLLSLMLLPAPFILTISPNLLFNFTHPGRWQFLYIILIDKLWIFSLLPFVFYLRYSKLNCFLHSFLSADIWRVFWFLNTSVILVSPIVTAVFLANVDYSIHLTWFTLFSFFAIVLGSSYLISFFLVVFAQNPVKNFATSLLIMTWGKKGEKDMYWVDKNVRGIKRRDSDHKMDRSWYNNWQQRIRSSISSIYSPEIVSKVYVRV